MTLNNKKNKINKKLKQDKTNILIKIFNVLMILTFTYITYNILFNNNHLLINVKPLTVIITLIVYSFLILAISKILNKLNLSTKKYFIISFIIYIIIQFLFGIIFSVIPDWDFGEIFVSAVKDALNEEALYNSPYFYIYTNNMAYGLLLSTLFKIMHLFGISSPTIFGGAGIVLNIIFIDIGIIYLYKIITKYFKETYHKIFIFLVFLFTPYLTYIPIFYTDTLVLPFVIISLYYLIELLNNGKSKNVLLKSSLLLGIAYCLKPTAIIILIAFIITYLLTKNSELIKIKLANLLKIIAIFLIPTILLNGYININFDKELLNQKSIPITHWLMMGLSNNGGYNQDDVDYTKSFPTKEKKAQANKKEINKRINDMIKYNKVVKFYTNKIIFTWGDGTYYAPRKLVNKPNYYYEFKNLILPTEQNKNKLFIALSQSRHVAMLLLIIIGCILRNNLDEKQQKIQTFSNISIFGIFLFYLLWEARSRYLIIMTPALIISSFLGIVSINKYLKNKGVIK